MSEVDWDNMIDVESKVIRLQAFFRGKLTLKQLENDAMEIKRKIHPSSNIPEYTAVEYFVFSLKSRGLTPESFFRICDSTYTKSVPVEVFKNKIAELKIKLADTQIRRLVLIFDEDMEGTISLAEFQNTLEAFGLSAERHIDPSNPSIPYKPFPLRTMNNLIDVFKQKGGSADSFYNSSAKDRQGRMTMQGLEQSLMNMMPAIQIKQVEAIKSYVDPRKTGVVTKETFVQAIERSQREMRQESTDY
jgi:Ca2+-binding EF-hand superfamily protein